MLLLQLISDSGIGSPSLVVALLSLGRKHRDARSEKQVHILQLDALGLGDEEPGKDDGEDGAGAKENEGTVGDAKKKSALRRTLRDWRRTYLITM